MPVTVFGLSVFSAKDQLQQKYVVCKFTEVFVGIFWGALACTAGHKNYGCKIIAAHERGGYARGKTKLSLTLTGLCSCLLATTAPFQRLKMFKTCFLKHSINYFDSFVTSA